MVRPSDAELLLRVKDLSKEFKLYDEADRSLKGTVVRYLRTGKTNTFQTKKVLREISFDLRQGDVIGIVGENGAGKSTLLKVITGILSPTSGTVMVNGRIVALLEIGLGFNDDLTGRENSFLYGSLLGITNRRMKEMLEAIVRFAELEEFIDLPIRKYSSGMKMRLAFSIATAIDPEILILDEVFSVGDVFFKKKSEQRLAEIIARGRGLLLVTHDLATVLEVCNRALFITADGTLVNGTPQDILSLYAGRLTPS